MAIQLDYNSKAKKFEADLFCKGLKELKPNNRNALSMLFRRHKIHCMIDAVLEDRFGQAYADNEYNPTISVLKFGLARKLGYTQESIYDAYFIK